MSVGRYIKKAFPCVKELFARQTWSTFQKQLQRTVETLRFSFQPCHNVMLDVVSAAKCEELTKITDIGATIIPSVNTCICFREQGCDPYKWIWSYRCRLFKQSGMTIKIMNIVHHIPTVVFKQTLSGSVPVWSCPVCLFPVWLAVPTGHLVYCSLCPPRGSMGYACDSEAGVVYREFECSFICCLIYWFHFPRVWHCLYVSMLCVYVFGLPCLCHI